jgi:hypothetical protein
MTQTASLPPESILEMVTVRAVIEFYDVDDCKGARRSAHYSFRYIE